ncbi:MAG TPA: helix-turn-helix domain-containing protein [Solirubrobacteraceae bacterium]|nr:helix-turn-helix domain-containing protein [Solirubrobacteraceae bacterium]
MSAKVPRPYEKRRRAEAELETRRRITEATVELHKTVGPARTTISAVAERAGVQRATVYRHFPTDGDLFAACSAHWIGLHPYPAPDAWAAIADPEQRMLTALGELYAYYRSVEPMLANVRRDAQLLPALRAAMAGAGKYFGALIELLDAGWDGDATRRQTMLALALDFATWQKLTERLSDADAAALMTRMVACARH